VTDTEHILHVLLHDLRTPLGIAQGYLRLLREQRLTTPDEQARAMSGAGDALGAIARLCADAGALMAARPSWPPARVPALTLIDALTERARARAVPVHIHSGDARRALSLVHSIDQTADAVLIALAGAPHHHGDISLHIELTDEELCVLGDRPAGLDEHRLAVPATFDPWRRPGLAIPLACRLITDCGGRLWSVSDAPAFTGIALPLESVPR
jgi:signal transduction histidine kinase